MSFAVYWTDTAQNDLAGIVEYIYRESPQNARNVFDSIKSLSLADLQQLPWIQQALMIIGGLFLAKMGWAMLTGGLKSLKRDAELEAAGQAEKPDNYFMLGLFTNLSNPKTLIYFSSVFSLALSSSAGAHLKTQLAFIIPIQTFLVFSALMLILSMPKIKALYQRSGSYIDIISGALFLAFAVWLWLDALQVL